MKEDGARAAVGKLAGGRRQMKRAEVGGWLNGRWAAVVNMGSEGRSLRQAENTD